MDVKRWSYSAPDSSESSPRCGRASPSSCWSWWWASGPRSPRQVRRTGDRAARREGDIHPWLTTHTQNRTRRRTTGRRAHAL